MSRLLRIKPMSMLSQEASEEGEHTLKRSLGALNLITLGIGAVIGAGIFVLTGQAAALHAGPAVALSFVLAGFTCAFAGLCYAEFASIIPIAGSAYTYGYATLGELVAWIIGWDLCLEYAFGAATVASGWAGYFNSLLQQIGIYIPPQLTATTGTQLYFYQKQWLPEMSLPMGVSTEGLPHAVGFFNLIAVCIVVLITTILVIGIKESANFNSAIVIVKLAIVGIFLVVGGYFLFRHPAVASANWHPFVPPPDGHGNFGWGGIPTAAASIFFAYIGFDAVSTAAQEARNPQRDMPRGILGSLVICTILYILVAFVLTGIVSYKLLAVPDPIAVGIDAIKMKWLSPFIKLGAIAGLSSVILVMLMSQPRIFFTMSKDGLLPGIVSRVHPKFRTPWITTIITGVVVMIASGVLPLSVVGELVSIGTLAAFAVVCVGVLVLRITQPEVERPFRTPAVYVTAPLGAASAVFLMSGLPLDTWIRLIVWMVIGLVIYFLYGARHSKIKGYNAEPALSELP
ncbi:MAG TPA: amino acid permease [Terracidiphilus sp.]